MVAQDALKKNLSVAYLIDDEVLSRPLLGDPVRVRQVCFLPLLGLDRCDYSSVFYDSLGIIIAYGFEFGYTSLNLY